MQFQEEENLDPKLFDEMVNGKDPHTDPDSNESFLDMLKRNSQIKKDYRLGFRVPPKTFIKYSLMAALLGMKKEDLIVHIIDYVYNLIPDQSTDEE